MNLVCWAALFCGIIVVISFLAMMLASETSSVAHISEMTYSVAFFCGFILFLVCNVVESPQQNPTKKYTGHISSLTAPLGTYLARD